MLDDFHEVADDRPRRPRPAAAPSAAGAPAGDRHAGRPAACGSAGCGCRTSSPSCASPTSPDARRDGADARGRRRVAGRRTHVRRLWEHTEGWAGALRLAALSLRDHPDPGAFVDDFAGDDRAISDYLISEVMSRMSRRGARLPAAHVDRQRAHRRPRRRADRPRRRPPAPGRARARRRCCSRRSTGAATGTAITRCSASCCRPSCAATRRALRPGAAPARRGLARRGTATTRAALVHAVEAEAWDLAARLAGERWVDLLLRGEVGALRPADRAAARAQWAVEDPEVALAVASALLDRGDHAEAARLLLLRRGGRGPRAGRAPAALRRLVLRAPALRRAPARRPRRGAGDRARAVARR